MLVGVSHHSLTRVALQAKASNDFEDGWQPVSPRKHVAQRRLTSDTDAKREVNKDMVYNMRASTNPFEILSEAPTTEDATGDTRCKLLAWLRVCVHDHVYCVLFECCCWCRSTCLMPVF